MLSDGGGFWSGETLNERLKDLIDPFCPSRLDCASYVLSVGPEVYVSPNEEAVDRATATIRKLAPEEAFVVPPGQFAFLLTEEVIEVPNYALAFISMRAKIKFRGLVNVSGFHVDPGFRGQLTYGVFNAGPRPVHLKRGQEIFLIWYTNLDRSSTFKKVGRLRRGLDPELITGIAGEVQSFAGLSAKIDDVEKKLDKRVHSVEKQHIYYRVIAILVLALTVFLAKEWIEGIVETGSAKIEQVRLESNASRE